MKGGKGQRGLAPPDQKAEDQQLKTAKELRARIQMEQKVRQYKKERYPQKSIEQILRRIRERYGAFGEAVAIAMIKKTHRPEELDLPFIAEEEATILRLGQPLLETSYKR